MLLHHKVCLDASTVQYGTVNLPTTMNNKLIVSKNKQFSRWANFGSMEDIPSATIEWKHMQFIYIIRTMNHKLMVFQCIVFG